MKCISCIVFLVLSISLVSADVTFFDQDGAFIMGSSAAGGVVAGTTSGSSGGGGGGSSGGGGGAAFACGKVWECAEWSECIYGWQIRDCRLADVPQYTGSAECPSFENKPETRIKCEARIDFANETCNDGVKSRDEEGIDCGGICGPCEKGAGSINGSTNLITGFAVDEEGLQWDAASGWALALAGISLLAFLAVAHLFRSSRNAGMTVSAENDLLCGLKPRSIPSREIQAKP